MNIIVRTVAVTAFITFAPVAGAAKPPEQLGTVNFQNSCQPAVQTTLTRAVALLHSFWWQEGERTFRQVLAQDPGCAIATWGIAAILISNPFGTGPTPDGARLAMEAIEQGRAIGPKTERERYYIEAIAEYYDRFGDRSHQQRLKALAGAFQLVASRYPEDDEAQIFSALYLTATQDPADKSFATALKAAGILEDEFRKHPDHPGVAHYLIHSYDYPPIAAQGLGAARRYAQIAPSAPHAQHMPSHIFTRVGAWADSAASNERSAAVAKAEKEYVDQLHAMDYQTYAYLQLARDTDALRLVAEAPTVQKGGPNRAISYALAAIPARYAVERGAWREAAELTPQATRFRYADAITHFARALGAARSGDTANADKEVRELGGIVEALKAAHDNYWTTEVEVQRLGAAAWAAYARGERENAIAQMRAAADLEDKSEKSAVSPGRLMPARELLGDMLLESGSPEAALAEYERSQIRDPNRFRSLYGAGLAAIQSANSEKARYYFGRLMEMTASGGPRPELAQAKAYLAANR